MIIWGMAAALHVHAIPSSCHGVPAVCVGWIFQDLQAPWAVLEHPGIKPSWFVGIDWERGIWLGIRGNFITDLMIKESGYFMPADPS